MRSALAILLVVSAGCASLPDVRQALGEPRADAVAFQGTHGPVSASGSERILARLEGGTGESAILATHLAHEQAFNPGSPLSLGNRVVLLQDGPATYAAMERAIAGATDRILLETYIYDADEIGRRFADLLLARRAAGVSVLLMYDSMGSLGTPAAFFEGLRAGGIQVVEFNPVNPLSEEGVGWSPNHRDHRKLLVVDGRVAFVGGINISKVYSSSPFKRRGTRLKRQPVGWRDTHVQIEGPVVAEFETLFRSSWTTQRGPSLPPPRTPPVDAASGTEIVRAIGSVAGDPGSPMFLTLLSAITHAEHSVQLTVAYFSPDPQLLDALTDAAGRGVAVELVLPRYSDSWAIFHLGRSHYTELLKGGVAIHERKGALMHSKTATIDGVWSTVGSSNLDMRSFVHNDEVNAVVLGRGFAAQMETMFARDRAESERIALERWRQRPLYDRLREWLARLGAYWL